MTAVCYLCHGVQPEDYMAVWEAMLEARRTRHYSVGVLASSVLAPAPGMNALWDRVGTAAMRGIATDVARQAVEGFEALPADLQEGFDWEFVPQFLRTIIWENYK